MKRLLPAIAVVLAVAVLSFHVSGPEDASAQPITGGGGLQRCYHGSAFYGLCTSGTPLDLRHDCSSGSGLTWDGANWNCAATGGGFTTAGWGLVGSGSTISLSSSGCSTGYVPTWTGSTFACQAQSGGGSAGYGSALGSGAITVSTATTGSTVNLSTLGIIDWLSVLMPGGANPTRTSTACTATGGTCWMKKLGGGILADPGVDWVGTGSTPFTGAGAVTFSSTNTDTVTGSALSSTSVSGFPTNVGGGVRFMLPSPGGNIQRVGRIYLYQVGNTVVCTAHAIDGSAPDATGTSNVASGTALQTTYTVTYTTNAATYVVVVCAETVSNGGTPNVAWGAVSLGFV